ncbi:low affinity iron permease family protein [Xanthomonas tesorieronis]|uniref:low affinity iron permease family protein n=1 Tax=Xanthomonas tesorieronis TaxID=3160839 RepID=UPI0035178405
MKAANLFNAVAKKASYAAGTPWTFCIALGIVVLWGASGPVFGFNDTWQLVINTGTTIITFLMVFLIQHTQNADTAAMQIKLDELIRVTAKANDELLNLEEMDEKRLEQIRKQYEALASKASEALRARNARRGGPDAQDDAPRIGGGDDEDQ